MPYVCFMRWSIVLAAILLPAFQTSGQSSAIEIPASHTTANFAMVSTVQAGLPNSLPVHIQNWEEILSRRSPEIRGKISVRELIDWLAQVGLPVYLDQSAIDDDVTSEDILDLPDHAASLFQRLDYALKLRNAVLVVCNDQLSIISRDVASDPEYFCTITYDVTDFDIDSDNLEWLVKNSVAPDSWDDTNGDGSFVVLNTNGRRLLVVSQSYPIQISIRRLFGDIRRVTGMGSYVGSRTRSLSNAGSGWPTGSSSASMPDQPHFSTQTVVQSGRHRSAPHKSGGIF